MENCEKKLDLQKNMRDKDVLFSLILFIGSIALIIYSISISIQAMNKMEAQFYISPGFTILIIAIFLLFMSISLFFTARKQGGSLKWLFTKNLLSKIWNRSSKQTMIVFVYLFFYMVLGWARVPLLNIYLPFWFTTFIFLCLMMITFRATKLLNIIIISALTSFLIDFAFTNLAQVPLP